MECATSEFAHNFPRLLLVWGMTAAVRYNEYLRGLDLIYTCWRRCSVTPSHILIPKREDGVVLVTGEWTPRTVGNSNPNALDMSAGLVLYPTLRASEPLNDLS